MDYKDIHIGDRVRIRSWEDMAQEFGTRACGNSKFIPTFIPFVWSMRRFCGQEFTVSKIRKFSQNNILIVWFYEEYHGGLITQDMLEPAESAKEPQMCEDTTAYDPISTEELAKFLNS